MYSVFVSSTSNLRFRYLQSLRNAKVRKADQCTAVEGEKEIEIALTAGVNFLSVFFVKSLHNPQLLQKIHKAFSKVELIELDENLFSKVSYRESTGGMIAIVESKIQTPYDLNLPENPLVLVVEGVEKPGNLGAILRTADAVKADAVIACQLPSDLYNPNVIRASLGTIFSVPVAIADNAVAMKWLKENKIKTFCSNLHQAVDYFSQNYTGPTAIVVGTEADGVTQAWIDFADANVKIPMLGIIDSMNVSVAAAIMLYEARRQRS